VLEGDKYILSWNPSGDSETAQDALTYNVRIGSTTGDIDICAPEADLSNGFKRNPDIGNAQTDTFFVFKPDPDYYCTPFYWSVQTVDNGFLSSPFAPEEYIPANVMVSAGADTAIQFGQSVNLFADAGSCAGISYTWAPAGSLNNPNIQNPVASPTQTTVYSVTVTDGSTTATDQITVYVNPFTEIVIPGIPKLGNSAMEWCDVNNDGYLDFFITGRNSSSVKICKMYINNGLGSFFEQSGLTVTPVIDGDVEFGDFNNDGFVDIIITGESSGGLITELYVNNMGSNFQISTASSFPGLEEGNIEWADYNNDGYLDLILTGQDALYNPHTHLFKNTGTGTFTEQTGTGLIEIRYGKGIWGDYNNDGYPDLLFSGSGTSGPVTKLYRNNSGTGFIEQMSLLQAVAGSEVKWGDYNSDGFLDIILSGYVSPDDFTALYMNDGAGGFTEQNIFLPDVSNGAFDWGDMDNDGLLDLIIAGNGNDGYISHLFRNDGAGNFTKIDYFDVIGVYNSNVEWADFDNDNDLDLFLSGVSGSMAFENILLENHSSDVNLPPAVPTGLTSSFINDSTVVFRWNKSTDTETPSDGLTYNIRVGSGSNLIDIVSPHADLGSGIRRIAEMGNALLDTFFIYKPPISMLCDEIYWSVQTIDNSFIASGFSNEQIVVNYYYLQDFDTICPGTQISWHGNTYDTPGIYYDSLMTIGGCDSTWELNLAMYTAPQQTVSADTLICLQDSALLHSFVTGGTPGYLYEWSNAETIPDIWVMPLFTTEYFVTVSDVNNCSDVDSVTVNVSRPYGDQGLCLVSVDPIVGKNKVMWEKVPDVGAESYLVQKEISTNVYSVIGTVPAADTSYFIDYASNPESHGDKYKITVLDTCGNESELDSCAYHKTINLVIAAFGSTMGLSWDYYEVEDGSFVPDKYYIYRGTTPSNLQVIDSVSGSFNTYNDVNVYNVYYYMVGAAKASPCDLNVDGTPVYIDKVYSNKKDNDGLVSIYENKGWKPLSIYPNPASETVTIEFPNPENEPYTISITDITGKQIQSCRVNNAELSVDIRKYASGIYFI
ncbi:MAG: T9SS type A sorting domain-containing protein, partial [Bacteroidota bacterium]